MNLDQSKSTTINQNQLQGVIFNKRQSKSVKINEHGWEWGNSKQSKSIKIVQDLWKVINIRLNQEDLIEVNKDWPTSMNQEKSTLMNSINIYSNESESKTSKESQKKRN